MKLLIQVFAIFTLTVAPTLARAQSASAGGIGGVTAGQRSAAMVGEVERDGSQLRLVLTNPNDARAFQGSASVSVGASGSEANRLMVTLAPGETRAIALNLSASANDQYTLAVYNQTGTLVLYKISAIKPGEGSQMKTIPGKVSASKKDPGDLKVSARLTRGLASRNAELPTSDTDEPFLLTFEIETTAPIQNASLTLESKGFQRSQKSSMQTRAALEFKLPETLVERKLRYTLTNDAGQQLASGEIDLDQLTAAESVTVGALTFDRPAYAPGESARASIEIQGDASSGYRLEVTAKDGGGAILFKTERRGSISEGKSREEFMLEIPREAKGPILLAYQVFGGQTGALFDSGERAIILNVAQDEKSNSGKRLSP